MDFLIKMIRIFIFTIDKVIYGLIDDVYALLLQLCRTSIFTQDVISEFAKRVYALVGIFMLFKVTISIITYILNPDEFSDKEKGFTSIIKHVILSLVLIVIVPYIFSEAYDLQTIILEDNTIMNLVFGTPADAHMPNSSYVESAGNKIQFTLAFAFAQPNVDDFYSDQSTNLAACKTIYAKDENGNFKFRALPKFDINVASQCEAGKSCFIYELNPECFGTYNPDTDTYTNGPLYNAFKDADGYDDSIGGESLYQNYAQGIAQQNFNLFFRKDIVLATHEVNGTKRYIIDYKMIVSTAVGVGVIYLLLLFCIDIAVRSVKLGFLQMIAPIPIVSYCDPKSKKDGMFSKWLRMCINTYLELFMRLFALYFGIYVISLIGTFRDVITNQKVDGFLVSVFMIVGILIFVKKLPEILKEVLNIKGDGKFQFNPLKKFEDEAFLGKNITGAAASALVGRHPGTALRAFAQGKGWNEGLKYERGLNDKLRQAKLNGSTFGGRMEARAAEFMGRGGELGRIQTEKQKYQDAIDELKNKKDVIEGRIQPTRQKIADQKRFSEAVGKMETRAKERMQEGQGTAGLEYLRRKAEFESAKASGSAADIARTEKAMNDWLNDTGMKAYMNEVITGGLDDATFENYRKTAEQAGQTIGVTLASDGATIHSQYGAAKGRTGDLEREIYEQEQQITSYDTEIKGYNEKIQDATKREHVASANRNAIK